MNLTEEEIRREQYLLGKLTATREWAHWKDGVQYVGSCGTTLEQALAPIHKKLAAFQSKRDNLNPQRIVTIDGQ